MRIRKILTIITLPIVLLTLLVSDSKTTTPQRVITPAISIASLGDSITQAANSCEPWVNCPDYSWSTGSNEEVNSHAQQLQALYGQVEEIKIFNNAQSFTKMVDVPRQAALATSQRAEYITILSGANDVCSPTIEEMTSIEDYKKSFTEALGTIYTQLPLTKTFVASIPSLYNLWELGKNNPDAVSAWDKGKNCQSMLANATSSDQKDIERRAAVEQRITEYNKVLQEVCDEYKNCLFDNNAVYNHQFSLTEISDVDYFHPSISGQNALAEITWKNITYDFIRINRGTTGSTGNSPPIVEISSPKNNDTVSGEVILIVNVVSQREMEEVYVKTPIGNFPLEQVSEYRYQLAVDSALAPNGTSVMISVIAKDSKGNTGVSEDLNITILNTIPIMPSDINTDANAPVITPVIE
jgi:lysophospholipase L1-like esterase